MMARRAISRRTSKRPLLEPVRMGQQLPTTDYAKMHLGWWALLGGAVLAGYFLGRQWEAW
jgi:hypothetical protein